MANWFQFWLYTSSKRWQVSETRNCNKCWYSARHISLASLYFQHRFYNACWIRTVTERNAHVRISTVLWTSKESEALRVCQICLSCFVLDAKSPGFLTDLLNSCNSSSTTDGRNWSFPSEIARVSNTIRDSYFLLTLLSQRLELHWDITRPPQTRSSLVYKLHSHHFNHLPVSPHRFVLRRQANCTCYEFGLYFVLVYAVMNQMNTKFLRIQTDLDLRSSVIRRSGLTQKTSCATTTTTTTPTTTTPTPASASIEYDSDSSIDYSLLYKLLVLFIRYIIKHGSELRKNRLTHRVAERSTYVSRGLSVHSH
jgi:hypothetical protein